MCRAFTQVGLRLLTGKQPFAGAIFTPISSQIRKQPLGKNRVTILFAFAAIDAYHHTVSITFDVMGLKANQFTDAQPCAINGLQQQPMFKIISCSKQPFYFWLAKNSRQFFNPGPGRDLKLGIVPFTNMPVKTDNAGQISVAGALRQFTIFELIADIVLDLVVCQGIGRLHVIFG